MADQLGGPAPRRTSSSTAEAETASLYQYTKHEGIPMQILLDALLADPRRPIELIAEVDNTQAITAVHKGYIAKLCFLKRTHECSIGTLHRTAARRLCANFDSSR